MVNVSVIGRLGADSEIRTNKNGSQFLHFRMATDEFKNGKNETSWLSVACYGERSIKMQQWLTKGKPVSVHGIETVDTYTDRNGQVQISRDILADRVDFVSVGGSGQTESNSSETVGEEQQISAGTMKQKEVPQPQAVQPQAAALADDDDLPF